MIKIKSEEEIRLIKEGGVKLREVVKKLIPIANTGISTQEIDKKANELILAFGGEPSFKRVKNYFWTTCLPINEQIVHTKPSSRKLREGDLLTIDIGMYYKGFNTDFATSFFIGKPKTELQNQFLETGKEALNKAIKTARVGCRLGNISKAIEETITKKGYFVIKELTGHGIGRDLHEDPYIPGFLDRDIEKTIPLESGMVLAIEVIYSLGTSEMVFEENDDWSITTADKSLSACFEHTIAIMNENTFVLT